MKKTCTIKVSEETKEKLRKRGEKGMTYEDIILDLLKKAEELERLKKEVKIEVK
jgi:hypothetical protein